VKVVADSGALYALYDRDDAHHAQVLKVFKQAKCTLIIPAVLLSEIDYLLREFLGVEAELDFLGSLIDGHYMLEPLNEADLRRSRELVRTYRDLDLGLADAAVVATAERLNIRHIFTVDLKHFRAVKPKKGNLVLLPADFSPGR
jgi:uncharacterized protein